MTPEQLAHLFHDTYEHLAPQFGYETRKESAKRWSEVPDQNKQLMIAVCGEIMPIIVRSYAQPESVKAQDEARSQVRMVLEFVEHFFSTRQMAKKILDWIDHTRQNIELDNVTMPRTRETILIEDIETLCKQAMEG
jgi:hypothetical protein